eukprot:m.73478 g.73478  ORF g.73478 m.73478 type:complete len:472 (+) comp24562_c1_seq1:264-1679(+)
MIHSYKAHSKCSVNNMNSNVYVNHQFSSWALLFWVVVACSPRYTRCANDDDDNGAQSTQTVVKLGSLEGDFLWGALAITVILGFVLFYVCSTKVLHCFGNLPVRAEMLRSDTFTHRLTKTIKLQGGELKYVSQVDLPAKDTISLVRSNTSGSTTNASNVTTTSFASSKNKTTLRERLRKVATSQVAPLTSDVDDDVTPPPTAGARPIITPKKVVVIPMKGNEVRATPQLLPDGKSLTPEMFPRTPSARSNNDIYQNNNNHVKHIDIDDENNRSNTSTTMYQDNQNHNNNDDDTNNNNSIHTSDGDDDDAISSARGRTRFVSSMDNHNGRKSSKLIAHRDLNGNHLNHNNTNHDNINNTNRANRNRNCIHARDRSHVKNTLRNNKIQPQKSLCKRHRQLSNKRSYDLDNSTPAAQAWVTGVAVTASHNHTRPKYAQSTHAVGDVASHNHSQPKYAQSRRDVGVARTTDEFVW